MTVIEKFSPLEDSGLGKPEDAATAAQYVDLALVVNTKASELADDLEVHPLWIPVRIRSETKDFTGAEIAVEVGSR